MYLCSDKIRGSVPETDGKILGAVLICDTFQAEKTSRIQCESNSSKDGLGESKIGWLVSHASRLDPELQRLLLSRAKASNSLCQ